MLVLMLATGGAGAAPAADRCTGFKWDISQELALFDSPGAAVTAGRNAATAPVVASQRLYQVQLAPQATVTFPVAPGRNSNAEVSYAGVAELDLAGPGEYRIAVDAPLWIDVAGDGTLAAVTDFQGQQNCDGPHKIVEFDLRGAKRFMLQLSGAGQPVVRLTVTRAPARKL
jgi:hypothetical protein